MRQHRRRHYARPHLSQHISVARFQRHFDLAMKQVERGRIFYLTRDGEPTAVVIPAGEYETMQTLSNQ